MLENNSRIAEDAAIVDEAIISRRSVRAFLPDMVDDETIRAILTVAARAPSGTNMQPWRVYVTKGEVKQRISDAILNSGIRAEKAEWDAQPHTVGPLECVRFDAPPVTGVIDEKSVRLPFSSASAGAAPPTTRPAMQTAVMRTLPNMRMACSSAVS